MPTQKRMGDDPFPQEKPPVVVADETPVGEETVDEEAVVEVADEVVEEQPEDDPAPKRRPKPQAQAVTPKEPEPNRVFFRSSGADDLRQVLDDESTVQFRGGIFSTTDPAQIELLRRRIDKGRALFDEDDPTPVYGCPYCKFSSAKKATTNAHIRTRHPEQTFRLT